MIANCLSGSARFLAGLLIRDISSCIPFKETSVEIWRRLCFDTEPLIAITRVTNESEYIIHLQIRCDFGFLLASVIVLLFDTFIFLQKRTLRRTSVTI